MSSHHGSACGALLALAAGALCAFPTLGEGLHVVATIKPVHALVAGVMQGAGEPHLLLKGFTSPHSYAMRPSASRALQAADVVFWVGPQLETFLAKSLAALVTRARTVALLDRKGIVLLSARKGGTWEARYSHEHPHSRPDSPGHGGHTKEETAQHLHGKPDPHIWLDPDNGVEITRIIAHELSALDPANQSLYQENSRNAIASIERADRSIRDKLAPVRHTPYVVFHDAYQMFERHYGLNAVGSITVSPQHKPGARRLREVRDKIRTLDARCVFREPQFKPKLLRTVVEGSAARIGVLDPLGAAIPAGPQAYPRLLDNLADALVDCLAPGS